MPWSLNQVRIRGVAFTIVQSRVHSSPWPNSYAHPLYNLKLNKLIAIDIAMLSHLWYVENRASLSFIYIVSLVQTFRETHLEANFVSYWDTGSSRVQLLELLRLVICFSRSSCCWCLKFDGMQTKLWPGYLIEESDAWLHVRYGMLMQYLNWVICVVS